MSDKIKVYVCGPIKGLVYTECVAWRELVRDRLPKERFTVVSPLRWRECLDDGRILGGPYSDDEAIGTEKGIVDRDRFDVFNCDILLVNFLKAKRVSIGSCVEFGWADAFRKPIVTVMEKNSYHDDLFVRALSSYIVRTLDDGIEVVRKLGLQ